MQSIKLVNMELINFKGVRSLLVNFKDNTIVCGDNGTGKTTLFDAFNLLLFGKDSSDKKDFNIKTLDANNNPIHKLEHEVNAVLLVNSEYVKLHRVYKEKWVKKRGSELSEMQGHTQDYFYNDVPMSESEYKAKISGIIKEDIFKLLTNPIAFNSLKWQDRRTTLFNLIPAIKDEDIAVGNEDYEALLRCLTNKTLDEFKREIASKKKLVKNELDAIPTRIDEANRNKPEAVDSQEIQSKINELQEEITKIDAEIEDQSKSNQLQLDEIKSIQGKKHDIQMRINELMQQDKMFSNERSQDQEVELSKVTKNIATVETDIENNKKIVVKYTASISDLDIKITELRQKYVEENNKKLVINPLDECCPTCKQRFPESQLSEFTGNATKNFNTNKAKVLEEINTNGIELTENKKKAEQRISELETETHTLEQTLLDLKTKKDSLIVEIANIKSNPIVANPEIEKLEAELNAIVIPSIVSPDLSLQKVNKAACYAQIDQCKSILNNNDLIGKIDERIKQLESQEKELAQHLADLEKTEFTITKFSKAKIELMENKVNSKFKFVKFKMFETQINGGEVECCECLVNGVPYADVNTAGKINAGVDVINALIGFYEISAPVWVDNKESVNTIIPCEAQTICLVVSKDKQLVIN